MKGVVLIFNFRFYGRKLFSDLILLQLKEKILNTEIQLWCYSLIEGFGEAEGKRANIVDANLSILRERIQQVRKRERMIHTREWNYKRSYDRKYKRDSMISQSSEVIGILSLID
ncbi:hypothetical protein GLYMA_10G112600v4 [Glycine max]|uniref:Uncharacterized protein n=1 Tax=Glycine max TaxID=3847 RepID=A0A0R0I080_SOYBN|nr:hypothetical protein JHK85_028394 [Glycine max]KAG5151515.1 hypothetical protein JHK84_027987 [Glycine max]KAH1137758.1 hypothetical protein GYH30_027662 [Glycine max]KRH33285.1 hypothetical protein GLYMA_10G112600v4 [Glycine max]